MDYDPRSEPHNLEHDPTTSLVVPRPIGWITTISPEGVVNLAPYSFFNLISASPPFVMFSSSSRKHSQHHAELSGEFVFNLATWELREEMNLTSAIYPRRRQRGRRRRASKWCRRARSSRRASRSRRSRSNASMSRPSR